MMAISGILMDTTDTTDGTPGIKMRPTAATAEMASWQCMRESHLTPFQSSAVAETAALQARTGPINSGMSEGEAVAETGQTNSITGEGKSGKAVAAEAMDAMGWTANSARAVYEMEGMVEMAVAAMTAVAMVEMAGKASDGQASRIRSKITSEAMAATAVMADTASAKETEEPPGTARTVRRADSKAVEVVTVATAEMEVLREAMAVTAVNRAMEVMLNVQMKSRMARGKIARRFPRPETAETAEMVGIVALVTAAPAGQAETAVMVTYRAMVAKAAMAGIVCSLAIQATARTVETPEPSPVRHFRVRHPVKQARMAKMATTRMTMCVDKPHSFVVKSI